jgi:hypothetical protein
MGKELKLFLIGISNSFNPNGYNNIVTPPRKLGESSHIFNKKLKQKYKTDLREYNEQIEKISCY